MKNIYKGVRWIQSYLPTQPTSLRAVGSEHEGHLEIEQQLGKELTDKLILLSQKYTHSLDWVAGNYVSIQTAFGTSEAEALEVLEERCKI